EKVARSRRNGRLQTSATRKPKRPPRISTRSRRKREAERQREKAALAKQRQRRDKAIAKAQRVLDQARRDHDAKAAAIDAERAAPDKRAQSENDRWEKQRETLSDLPPDRAGPVQKTLRG